MNSKSLTSRLAPLGIISHAFIIGTFSSIQLYAVNLSFLPLSALAIPLGLSLAGTLILLGVARALLRSWSAGSIAVSCFLLALIPLPYAQAVVWMELPPDTRALGQLVATAIYCLAVATGAYWVARLPAQKDRQTVHVGLNFAALAFLASHLVDLAEHLPTTGWHDVVSEVRPSPTGTRTGDGEGRDIYYIVLDGYGRDDVLAEYYGIPRNSLTAYLGATGFYVAPSSRANYVQTYLSLASSLNMGYLTPLATFMGDSNDRQPLEHLIEHSAVMSELRAHGYTTILISSNYYATDGMSTVDYCLCDVFRPTDFDATWLAQTPVGVIPPVRRAPYDAHRQKLMSALAHLRQPLPGASQRFVLAHLIAPHPPFVFESDGKARYPSRFFSFRDGDHFLGSQEHYVDGYRSQLAFLNAQLKSAVESIMDRTRGNAIIILQSDHGPGSRVSWESAEQTDMRERTGILSAYYLPARDTAALYESISPVNTFRVVLNEYLGASYELLPDRSYFSQWSRPYRFVDVTTSSGGTPGKQEPVSAGSTRESVTPRAADDG